MNNIFWTLAKMRVKAVQASTSCAASAASVTMTGAPLQRGRVAKVRRCVGGSAGGVPSTQHKSTRNRKQDDLK